MSKLDNILKVFNATAVKLEKLIAANEVRTVGNQESINNLMSLNADIKEETKRAKRVQSKVQELIG
jgi:hypothetical protein